MAQVKKNAKPVSTVGKAVASTRSRILDVWYVKDASLTAFKLSQEYTMIAASDNDLVPDPSLILSGVDIGLFRLHISRAEDRRRLLGLKKDERYEIMVNFSPVHLHGTENREVLKVNYGRFFDIRKDDSAGGFTYKKMFVNLKLKESLSFDIKLTEIDNDKVDPDPLSKLLNDTGIGKVLDLSPFNPKEYVQLASNFVSSIQNIFGSDKAGDDLLWDDTLTMEAKPTIPGSYNLCSGIYAIVEQQRGSEIKIDSVYYTNNALVEQKTKAEIKANYLIFGVGKALGSVP